MRCHSFNSRRIAISVLIALAVLVLPGCQDSNILANHLFGQVYQLTRQAELAMEPAQRTQLYTEALATLDELTTRYPDSEAARLLAMGFSIGNVSHKKLEDLQLAAAREQAFSVRTSTILPTASPPSDDATAAASHQIALASSLSGRLGKAYQKWKARGHFRAFSTDDDIDKQPQSWSSTWNYDTVEGAIKDSIAWCLSDVDATICRLFAIGDIVVYGMTTLEQEMAVEVYRQNNQANNTALPPPPNHHSLEVSESEVTAYLAHPDDAYRDYKTYKKLQHPRVFAASTPQGSSAIAWGWASSLESRISTSGNATLEAIAAKAISECEGRRYALSVKNPCQLFAVGDIVLAKLNQPELRAAIRIYENDYNTTNADLSIIPEKENPYSRCRKAPTDRCLLEVAFLFLPTSDRAAAMVDVAIARALAGHSASAKLLLLDAVMEAKSIRAEITRNSALIQIVKAQADTGNLVDALTTVELLPSQDLRDYASAFVAIGNAKAGDMEIAVGMAEAIKSYDRRTQALIGIATAQAASRNVDAALNTAKIIVHNGRRAEALASVCDVLVKQNNPGRALQIATHIEDSVWRSSAIIGIVEALARNGDSGTALQVVANNLTGVDVSKAAPAIVEILAKTGRMDEARAIAESIPEEGGHAWWRRKALLALVRGRAQAAPADSSFTVLDFSSIQPMRALALAEVARVQAAAGLFEKALEVADAINEPATRDEVLIEIAAAQAVKGEYGARRTLQRISQSQQDHARVAIAAVRAKVGQVTEAIEWWAFTSDNLDTQAEAFLEIAKVLAGSERDEVKQSNPDSRR